MVELQLLVKSAYEMYVCLYLYFKTINPCADCSADEFTCGSGECAKLTDVCDKKQDCSDFSDEINCSHGKRIESHSLQSIFFSPLHQTATSF